MLTSTAWQSENPKFRVELRPFSREQNGLCIFAVQKALTSWRRLIFAERVPVVILAGIILLLIKASWPLFLEIAVSLMTLFVVAVACHGELANRRPATEHLTSFYLWIALGGVLGGLFNAVVAPVIFSTVLEFPLALIFAASVRLPSQHSPQKAVESSCPVSAALSLTTPAYFKNFFLEGSSF